MSAQYPVSYDSILGLIYSIGTTSVPIGSSNDDPAFTNGIRVGSSPFIIKQSSDFGDATGVNFTKVDGTTSVLFLDLHNRRVGVNTTTPNQPLVVAGNARIDGQLAMGPSSPSAACLIDMINPFVGCGMPVMTTTQKNAISPHRAGNVVFDTDLGKLCVDNGASWETITSV